LIPRLGGVRRSAAILTFVFVVSSCGGTDIDFAHVPELPGATPASITQILTESTMPVVVNVWASWCVPCRAEAPLLARAAEQFSDRVLFVGVNFRNDQTGARQFIAEFFTDAPITHVFDTGDRIPAALGGTFGVPQTFFFAAGGELVTFHPAVIDERTLALQIDEILARSR